jgi:hypothetical protein
MWVGVFLKEKFFASPPAPPRFGEGRIVLKKGFGRRRAPPNPFFSFFYHHP